MMKQRREGMAMRNKITGFLVSLLAALILFAVPVHADTDEILRYTVFVEVNKDATLNLHYHFEWKVLDSGPGVGPVTWLKIGIPNSHVVSVTPFNDAVDHINRSGNYVEVYLDREYYEGEVIGADFLVVQDYMYQVDKLKEGETVYSFTPGWFDDIKVDELNIAWKNDNAVAFSPECEIDHDRNVWTTSLSKGEKFTVTMTYPNDAYDFDLSKSNEDSGESFGDKLAELLGSLLCLLITGGFVAFPFLIGYVMNRGFGGNSPTINKTTRVKVTYYDSCPGCGAPRKEGTKFCEYCGKSLVKSEETITDEQLKKEEKQAASFTKNGEFRYGSSPNTFIRVTSVRVPNPHYHKPSYSSGGRGGHSSCAHSSCACACACACAGGGRAGCTTKDFYNTNLKLSAIAKAVGAKNVPDKEESAG